MNIDSIKNGFVIDHIKAGNSMQVYKYLNLGELVCPVAIIKNATSKKMGKKDIIKIDGNIELNLEVLGYINHDATVNVVKNGEIVEKKHLELPETVTDVIKCKNPRCITTTEQDIQHIFKLTDRENRVYRCIYCEAKAND
ncbi:MAG: aspartate carbamoyltransferase regulatory subunit [Clostridia bacterium]|nr:aspartate carbamoyltransferase regulatory subunit [Clostridia bacterium]